MSNLYYFFYKNKNLISSIIAQEMGGEVQHTEKNMETLVKTEAGSKVKIPVAEMEGVLETDDTNGSREYIKAGDNNLADWLDCYRTSGENYKSDASMQIIEIKGKALTVDAVKFVTIAEAVSSNKRFLDLSKDVLNDLLTIYYPDPILCITASNGKKYIMPVHEEYIEASNWISQYGIEMSGEYEALVICENIFENEQENLEEYPELDVLLKRIDEFILEKTGIDLRNGTKVIPIAVYKRIGERRKIV